MGGPVARDEELRRKRAEMRNAARGLESLFIHELLKSMRATVPKSGLLKGGGQRDQYLSMFDIYLAEHLAKKGELGIASMVERQLGWAVKRENETGAKVSGISADE
jgi:Rod binding domain-containing protein